MFHARTWTRATKKNWQGSCFFAYFYYLSWKICSFLRHGTNKPISVYMDIFEPHFIFRLRIYNTEHEVRNVSWRNPQFDSILDHPQHNPYLAPLPYHFLVHPSSFISWRSLKWMNSEHNLLHSVLSTRTQTTRY